MKNTKTILCGGLVAMLVSCSSQMTTTNYYFDSVNNDDANNGASVGIPFKSLAKLQPLTLKGGDGILLKPDAIFTEKLLLSCCGEKNNPVIPDKYEGLEKPHIKENGADIAAVHALNSENLVIRDPEISNRDDVPKASLLGPWVELDKFGESYNMVIDDLYVHDTYGSTMMRKGGGIRIYIRNGRGSDDILNRFIGMIIEDCYPKDCRGDGVKFRGYWSRKQWSPNLGVAVRKNVLDGVPGDGIVLAGCDGGLIECSVMKNYPKTLPESEACDGIQPWCSDNILVQFNIVSDHRSVINGYAYNSNWGCRNSIFQYNLNYNDGGGFMLVIGTNGWPEDWCVNGNIETKIRYNVSINDELCSYLINASHRDACFSPVMYFTGYTQNTPVESNLFCLFPRPEPQIDRILFHFIRHDSPYGKGGAFKDNHIRAPEVIVAVKEEKAVGDQRFGNVYTDSLETPITDPTKQEGTFSKSLWYNAEDKNWGTLLGFLKDKTVPVNGKELRIPDIIGAS